MNKAGVQVTGTLRPRLRRTSDRIAGGQQRTSGMCGAIVLLALLAGVVPAQLPETSGRSGYTIDVPLPIAGDRDQIVQRQLMQIASHNRNAVARPVVVLRFVAEPMTDVVEGKLSTGEAVEEAPTRGSQFERCLALARFLTARDASMLRTVAYLPASVEGHAVLPVLACEEILVAPTAELGRAAIDEPNVDATIESAYRDIVSRRATLPEPVVVSMLRTDVEVYQLDLNDGQTTFCDRDDAEQLRSAGRVIREQTLWSGGGLAAYSGQVMRSQRWIARTIADAAELPEALDVAGSLRTARQLPRQWKAAVLTMGGILHGNKVNQLIRAIDEQLRDQRLNLLVVRLEECQADFDQASRLANHLAELDSDQLFTLGLIGKDVTGAAALIPICCDEAILISGASVRRESGPELGLLNNRPAAGRVLEDLAETSGRPASLLSAVVDGQVSVKEYIHQETGQRQLWADWQLAALPQREAWVPKEDIVVTEVVEPDMAERYRLIDGIETNEQAAYVRLGLRETPPQLNMPWLDSGIQRLLANSWLPRLLLTVGFFALMAELGNPGIGAGGFIAGLCFLGFFWIEGLNGNVEWLEILLFVGGLFALAIELFVLPGFGLFGIGGLLMLLVSVVLASQTFIWPATSAELNEVAWNLFWVACMAFMGMVGILFMHKHIERMPLFRWVALEPGGASDLDEVSDREAMVHWEHLFGQEGLTLTRLNPSGKAQFGRDVVAVIGTGGLIGEGVPVRVVEVRGNMVLVEEMAGPT